MDLLDVVAMVREAWAVSLRYFKAKHYGSIVAHKKRDWRREEFP